MTAKELMVGDWVKVKSGIDEEYYFFDEYKPDDVVQIRELIDYGINPVWAGAEVNSCLRIEDVEPIPLQKIHLAKNGFKATNESDTVFRYKDGYVIEVDFDEGMLIANIDPSIFLRIEFAEKELFMPITYLHELQHAMKLFDIDWEIKL